MLNLPFFIRESVILSDKEKELLAMVDVLPSELEVDQLRSTEPIQELLNAFIGDESTKNVHLQLKAKEKIAEGNISEAWKILLL